MKQSKDHASPLPVSLRLPTDGQIEDLRRRLTETPKFLDLSDAVHIVLDTGVQLGELLQLRYADVDQNRHTLLTGRKNSPRHIPFSDDTAASLRSRRQRSPTDEFIFSNGQGRRMSRQLKELSEAVGATLGFLILRRYWVFNLVMCGADISEIISLGGWVRPVGLFKRFAPSPGENKFRDGTKQSPLAIPLSSIRVVTFCTRWNMELYSCHQRQVADPTIRGPIALDRRAHLEHESVAKSVRYGDSCDQESQCLSRASITFTPRKCFAFESEALLFTSLSDKRYTRAEPHENQARKTCTSQLAKFFLF